MKQALEIIDTALKFGINPSLDPIKRICALLGNPEQRFQSIQVVGTNGKSSTSRYIAALLNASGYTTGLYTSPELVSITERIELEGSPVSETCFASTLMVVHQTAQEQQLELTEFELLTATALKIFADSAVDYAVLEVGLGGRWDATSVVQAQLVVATSVDLDHTAILGDTITQIAEEKAAILEGASQAVLAPLNAEAQNVFLKEAALHQVPVVQVPPVETLAGHEPEDHALAYRAGSFGKAIGSYQAQNKLTAFTAVEALLGEDFLSRYVAEEVMDSLLIPGRLQVVHEDPLFIIDAAHNPASARLLADTIQLDEAYLLLAILKDKDAKGIIEALVPRFTSIVVTETASSRALPVGELAKLVQNCSGITPQIYQNTQKAIDALLKQKQPILATGSITLAGEVAALLVK